MSKDRLEAAAHKSSYVENVLRHRMIAELSSVLWELNPDNGLQVFNSEVDNAGFDIVLKLNSAIRYVQLKQAHSGKVPTHCSTRLSFSKLIGSCVILMAYSLDDLTISGYRFFGNAPNCPMPSIDSCKASKAPGRRNAEGARHVRSNYRNVPVSRFTDRLSSLELLERLFDMKNTLSPVRSTANSYEALSALQGPLSQLPLEEELQKMKADEREREDKKFAEFDPLARLAGTWTFGDADEYVRKQRGDE
jgi:hypothetical protein